MEKHYQVTRELLIVETAIYPPDFVPASFSHPLNEVDLVRLHPMAYVENPPEAKESVFNWFLPGAESLQALLRAVGFAEVSLFAIKGERAIVMCRRSAPDADSLMLSYQGAKLRLEEAPDSAPSNAEVRFRVSAWNTGTARWLAKGEAGTERGAVRLVAHLLKSDEEELFRYYAGAVLPRDIAPDESISLDIIMRAPNTSGEYLIEFDMVSEHLAWFDDLNVTAIRHPFRVSETS